MAAYLLPEMARYFPMIICATDFTDEAEQAARAAAALARKLAEPLSLIHVIDEVGAELSVGSAHDAVYDPLRQKLRAEAEELRSRYSVDVRTWIGPGHTDDAVVRAAAREAARLVVVSTHGSQKQHRWLLGSVADDITQSSCCPVLVVRDASSIEHWLEGARALSVVVGVEPLKPVRAPLDWILGLCRLGRCELSVVQLVPPLPASELRRQQAALRAWAGELPNAERARFVVREHEGHTDEELCTFASESAADLLVLGAHQRPFVARLWHPSVSRAVLRHDATNVACVPIPRQTAVQRPSSPRAGGTSGSRPRSVRVSGS